MVVERDLILGGECIMQFADDVLYRVAHLKPYGFIN